MNETIELINNLKDNGITMEKIAVQFGVSYATVYRWATGKAKPRMAELKTLRQMLAKLRSVSA